MVKRKLRLDWTSLLLEEGPQGVLCIRKPNQEHWQFPGGKRHANDRDSRVTAVRESREETGVRLNIADITLVGSRQEFNHYTHHPFRVDLYQATLTSEKLASHFVISKEGEEVGIFTWTELNEMGNFSPFHRMLAEKFGIWRTK